jgi:HK97 family phage prohead protease
MDKILKTLYFDIKQVGEEDERTLRFVGSDETPDRDNDIIEVNGWALDQYMKNPVFLWAHEHDSLPVGKSVNVMVDTMSKKLLFDVKFPTAEEYPFADTIYKLYKGGYLNATSVGFHGKKYETRNDESVLNLPEWQRGRRYKEQELLELSAVPVPCNPNALVSIRSKGFGDDISKIFTEEDQKSGATISAANRAYLKSIHDSMDECEIIVKGCRERLKQFMDENSPEMPPGEPMVTRVADIEEIKSALAEIKQVLSLCQKSEPFKVDFEIDGKKLAKGVFEGVSKEIDLDAIEYVKSSEPPDEPGMDVLRKLLAEKFNTYHKEES